MEDESNAGIDYDDFFSVQGAGSKNLYDALTDLPAVSGREADFAWARQYVNSKNWIFAKTYASTTPHEYIVVHEGDSDRTDFRKMFNLIQKYGKRETFFGRPWTYLYLDDGYKYFAADGGFWEDDRYVLNRAREDKSY